MSKPNDPVKQIALVYNAEKERAVTEWPKLKRWLESRRIRVITASKVIPAMKGSECVIVLGGDGTVLDVARRVAGWELPVLGVNVGRLGFLAATEVSAMQRTLTRVLAGQWRIEVRTLLKVDVIAKGKKKGPFWALNDCVIRSGSTGRALSLHTQIRNEPLATYFGDGLIISTPTGSTAYNLAVSGPIVHPELDVLLLSPISAHTLAQRPLVIPPNETVSVSVEKSCPEAILCVDGQVQAHLVAGDCVTVHRAREKARLLMDPNRSFYQVLQTKLKWGSV